MVIVLVLLFLAIVVITALLVLLRHRVRAISGQAGAFANRIMGEGETWWRRGYGLWVHDVFVWRGSIVKWDDYLARIVGVETRAPTATERAKLRSVGDDGIVVVLIDEVGDRHLLAVRADQREQALGPFAP